MKAKNIVFFFLLCLIVFNSTAQPYWTMEDCVAHALEHNLNVRLKGLEADIKEQDWRIAKKELLPSVQGYANVYSNFGHSQDVFGTIQRNDNLNSNMGITAEIMLYNFGALKNGVRKARIEQHSILLEQQLMQRELIINVIQGYLDMHLKQALVVARDSAVVHALHLLKRSKRTAEIGTTAQSEVYEAQTAWARERQRLESAQIDVERARLHLAQLMRLDDEHSLIIAPLPPSVVMPPDYSPYDDRAIEYAYRIHPALQRLDTLRRGLDMERRLLKAQNYPVLKGSTSVGSTYFNPFRLSDKSSFVLQTKDNFAQQVAVTATIPIFNKGRTRLQLKQVDIAQEQLDLETQIEKQEILRQLQRLIFDLRSNQQQFATAEEVMIQAEKAMILTQKSYEAGKSSIYDYNSSRQQFIQAQSDWIQARYSMLFSHKMLIYQLTGKWKDESK